MKFHPELCVYQVVTYQVLGDACQDCETGAVPAGFRCADLLLQGDIVTVHARVCPTGWVPAAPKEVLT